MTDDDKDIINLPHYISATRLQMSIQKRGALFVPLIALGEESIQSDLP